jgi:hypothetical protein
MSQKINSMAAQITNTGAKGVIVHSQARKSQQPSLQQARKESALLQAGQMGLKLPGRNLKASAQKRGMKAGKGALGDIVHRRILQHRARKILPSLTEEGSGEENQEGKEAEIHDEEDGGPTKNTMSAGSSVDTIGAPTTGQLSRGTPPAEVEAREMTTGSTGTDTSAPDSTTSIVDIRSKHYQRKHRVTPTTIESSGGVEGPGMEDGGREHFMVGDRVRVTKSNSSTKGETAEVTDPSWSGRVKVTIDTGQSMGKTKSYLASELVLFEEGWEELEDEICCTLDDCCFDITDIIISPRWVRSMLPFIVLNACLIHLRYLLVPTTTSYGPDLS